MDWRFPPPSARIPCRDRGQPRLALSDHNQSGPLPIPHTPHFIAVFSFTLLSTLSFIFFSTGCASHSVAPAAQTQITTTRTASVPVRKTGIASGSVSLAPEYKDAVGLYGRHDFRGALAILNTLSADTRFASPTDQAFLRRQRDICQASLEDKPIPSAHAVSVASAASRKRTMAVIGTDCGPRALLLVCQEMGVPADLAALRKTAGTGKDGTTLEGLTKAAASVGLKAEGVQVDRDALAQLSTPAVAWMNGNHFVAVLSVRRRLIDGTPVATIHDPNQDRKEEIPQSELLERSGGILLTLTRRADRTDATGSRKKPA